MGGRGVPVKTSITSEGARTVDPFGPPTRGRVSMKPFAPLYSKALGLLGKPLSRSAS
jgi:hypothetical protein